ncbi:MAG: hypothetical protein R3B82_17800 [Sandaracinaceae bacterium]
MDQPTDTHAAHPKAPPKGLKKLDNNAYEKRLAEPTSNWPSSSPGSRPPARRSS